MIPAQDALLKLQSGNQRFVSDVRDHGVHDFRVQRAEVESTQNPFAILLGCSDSRVPAEIIFDQGLGDLFVIRVAGNIVCPSQVGSIEMAAERFGTRLVVVMGHTRCGAIQATLELFENPEMSISPNLAAIIDQVRPSLDLVANEATTNPQSERNAGRDALIDRAVRANIVASADKLRTQSEVLRRLIASDGLLIVGAEYSLASGEVEFFDGVPGQNVSG